MSLQIVVFFIMSWALGSPKFHVYHSIYKADVYYFLFRQISFSHIISGILVIKLLNIRFNTSNLFQLYQKMIHRLVLGVH